MRQTTETTKTWQRWENGIDNIKLLRRYMPVIIGQIIMLAQDSVAELSVLLLLIGFVLSLGNFYLGNNVLTPGSPLQQGWIWTQCVAVELNVGTMIARAVRDWQRGKWSTGFIYTLVSLTLLFVGVTVLAVEQVASIDVKNTAQMVLSSLHLSGELLTFIRSVALGLMVAVYVLEHLPMIFKRKQQQGETTSVEAPPTATDEALRQLTEQVTQLTMTVTQITTTVTEVQTTVTQQGTLSQPVNQVVAALPAAATTAQARRTTASNSGDPGRGAAPRTRRTAPSNEGGDVDIRERIRAIWLEDMTLSSRKIAEQIGVSHTTVANHLRIIREEYLQAPNAESEQADAAPEQIGREGEEGAA
jgi:DNA-binding CsgD family transcriptional regulator